MNIHPILVHFPIALLTIYAVIELIRVPAFQSKSPVFYIKFAFVSIGWIFSLIAAASGEGAEHIVGYSSLVETHSSFAGATEVVFGIIAVWYILSFLEKEAIQIPYIETRIRPILSFLMTFTKKIKVIIPILAFAGLILVTITGALGGAIVYGPDVDPIVRFIYNLLF